APVGRTAGGVKPGVLGRPGVSGDRVTEICPTPDDRQFTHAELAHLLGDDLVREFAPTGRLRCHDAEDPDGLVHLGTAPAGHDVEVSRLVTDADLTIYVNAATTRGFSGGWKSVCVGLSSYR